MKKKLLLLFAFLACVALTVVFGFRYFSSHKAAEYAPRAIPYIKQVIPELSKWEPAVARSYLAAEFLAKTSDERLKAVLDVMSKLGKLERLEEPRFVEIYAGSSLKGEKQTVLSYQADAHYSNGTALITLALLDRGDHFEVYNFNIQSQALLQ